MSYYNAVLADHPDLFWPLNEPSGTTFADVSGNNHPLTLTTGSPVLAQPSLVTKTQELASINLVPTSVLSCASYGAYNQALGVTWEGWFKTSQSGSTNPALIADNVTNNFLQLRLSATGQLEVLFFQPALTPHAFDSVAIVNDGNPHYFSVASDGTNVRIVIDGLQDSLQASGFQALPPNTSPITVGARDATHNPFSGFAQFLAFYNKPLTLAQSQAHFAAGGGGVNVPLLGAG